MIKILSAVGLSIVLLTGNWTKCALGDAIVISFPTAAQKENISKSILYSSVNSNCDFSVTVNDYPAPVFPKTKEAGIVLLTETVESLKHAGSLISSRKFITGKITGMEIKSYFTPTPSVKLIQAERIFFYKYKIYYLRCLFLNKKQAACEKDCSTFFSSLRVGR